MNSTDAMLGNRTISVYHFSHHVTDIITVRKTCRRPNVTCYKNLIIFCNNTTRSTPVTSCTLSNCATNFHKIFIPSRTLIVFSHSFNILEILFLFQVFFYFFCKNILTFFFRKGIVTIVMRQWYNGYYLSLPS